MFFKNKLLCVNHRSKKSVILKYKISCHMHFKKFTSNEVEKWDKFLPYITFAYREVLRESTGYSPFELLHGRTVRWVKQRGFG